MRNNTTHPLTTRIPDDPIQLRTTTVIKISIRQDRKFPQVPTLPTFPDETGESLTIHESVRIVIYPVVSESIDFAGDGGVEDGLLWVGDSVGVGEAAAVVRVVAGAAEPEVLDAFLAF